MSDLIKGKGRQSEVEKLLNSLAAEKIHKRRKQLGLTNRELAEAAGVSIQQLQKYERKINRMTVGKFLIMCRALQITPSEIMPQLTDKMDSQYCEEQLEYERNEKNKEPTPVDNALEAIKRELEANTKRSLKRMQHILEQMMQDAQKTNKTN